MTATISTQSLWPSLPKAKKGPLAILKEQALCLTKDTDELVHGWAAPTTFEWSGDEIDTKYGFHYLFYFRVPALDDYFYKLFSIREDGGCKYPLIMTPHEEIFKGVFAGLKEQNIYCLNGIIRINNEGDLMKTLKAVFAAPHTQETLSDLLGKVQ